MKWRNRGVCLSVAGVGAAPGAQLAQIGATLLCVLQLPKHCPPAFFNAL